MTRTNTLGTAGAAAAILALGFSICPETTSQIGGQSTFRYNSRTATNLANLPRKRSTDSTFLSTEYVSAVNEEHFQNDASSRQTSPVERLVGEIRRWNLLGHDWDGEGACAPNSDTVRQAEAFVRVLNSKMALPEPMLHATGRAGLYWKEGQLYADLEFLGDGRMAYFIERNGDRHKGVLNFDSNKMPSVFSTLLLA